MSHRIKEMVGSAHYKTPPLTGWKACATINFKAASPPLDIDGLFYSLSYYSDVKYVALR